MGDSKVKVAVRIRPMNRRGENRARAGPPQRRRQVPGAPLRGGRRVGSSRPAPGVRIRAGARPAHPETLSLHARPACAGRPSPRLHRVPGRYGPHIPVRCPFRRHSRPAREPFRPLALSLSRSPLPFQEGALVPLPPGLSSSFFLHSPLALASRSPRCLLSSCQCGPRPLGPHGSGLTGTAWDPEALRHQLSRPNPALRWPAAGKMAGILVYSS